MKGKQRVITGSVGHYLVKAYPDSEIPHYRIIWGNMFKYTHEKPMQLKEYWGTVQFTDIIKIEYENN